MCSANRDVSRQRDEHTEKSINSSGVCWFVYSEVGASHYKPMMMKLCRHQMAHLSYCDVTVKTWMVEYGIKRLQSGGRDPR